jgi:methyl-accepting chemotaxis protein
MAAQLDAVFKRLEQIDEISEATYLLLINASIHAANARGQEGTGLAVIASNVRELSRQTRSFNGEIGDQLERARGTITDARRSMSELARASQELDVVLESERRVRGMIEGALAFEAFTQRTIERANGAAVLIARAASDAVTALQFEDIVEQILAVVGRRVRALGGGDEATDAPTRDPAPQVSIVPGDVEIF